MRMPTGGLALLAALMSGAAQGQALEFKGVPFGSALQVFEAQHRTFECRPDKDVPAVTLCATGVQLCRADRYGCGPAQFEASTYAGERVQMLIAKFQNGTLEQMEVYFPSSAYQSISEALALKHGKPKTAFADTFAAVSGAKARNHTQLWSLAGGSELLITMHALRLNEGMLTMSTRKWEDGEKERDAARAKKRPGNM